MSQIAANASGYQLASLLNEAMTTSQHIHHQYPNIPMQDVPAMKDIQTNGSLHFHSAVPVVANRSRSGSIVDQVSFDGQRAQELMDNILVNTQLASDSAAATKQGFKTNAQSIPTQVIQTTPPKPVDKIIFHESIFGNIRIEEAAHKRRHSWEKIKETDQKLSPDGLKWAMSLYDMGKFAKAISVLDKFNEDTSYWRDILLPDVLLLRVECWLALSDYRQSLSSLEALLTTSTAQDIISKLDETDTSVHITGPEDEIERTARVFLCMGRLSTMKGQYNNARKEYHKVSYMT